jgi:two-component system, OmpR family, response regulator ResD
VKILVVDDAPEVVDSVRLGFAIQWREVDLLSAGTGKEALDLVEHESPDLVLLDVGLPEMDGFKVLAEMRPGWSGTLDGWWVQTADLDLRPMQDHISELI